MGSCRRSWIRLLAAGRLPLRLSDSGLWGKVPSLNPVAVLIGKALVELPPNFSDRVPVFPGLADSEIRTWRGAEGLAADVSAYGLWIRDEAARRLADLYPKVDGEEPLAWIWFRTVTCPNPACGLEMPLTTKWWLSRRKGRVSLRRTNVAGRPDCPLGAKSHVRDPQRSQWGAGQGRQGGRRTNWRDVCYVQSQVDLKYIRAEGTAGRFGHQMVAVVVPGARLATTSHPATIRSSQQR